MRIPDPGDHVCNACLAVRLKLVDPEQTPRPRGYPWSLDAFSPSCFVVIYTADPALLGRRFALVADPVHAGRGPEGDIVLGGDSVERRHAHFQPRTAAWWVVNDTSTSRTYVNDQRIDREVALAGGDRVKIGQTIFRYLAGRNVEAHYHEEIYRMTIIDGLTSAFVMRYLFESLEKGFERHRVPATLSVGVTSLQATHATAQDLVDAAAEQLQKALRAGGNRVASPDAST